MSALKKLARGRSIAFKTWLNSILLVLIICAAIIIAGGRIFTATLEEGLLADTKNVSAATADVLSRDVNEIGDKLREIQKYYDVEELVIFQTDGEQVRCYYKYMRGEPEHIYRSGVMFSLEDAGLESSRDMIESARFREPYLLDNCACSITPFTNRSNQFDACVIVALSLDTINAQRHDFIVRLVWIEIALCVILSSLSCVVYYLLIIRPVNELAELSKDFVQRQRSGESVDRSAKARALRNRGDEIGRLYRYFAQMERDISSYVKELTTVTAEKERIGAELNVANQIQASMLPNLFPPFPDRPEFSLIASMHPAKEVGGDFFDFFLLDEDHLALEIADVSGKGVPAALFMVITKILLKNAAQQVWSPKAALEKVNRQLCEANDAEMFVTAWVGILEISTGKLTCVNAGHEYPAIRHLNDSFRLIHDKHGFVLAGFENTKYHEYTIQLEPGDTLFVYTDGVPEATNDQGELFGTGRMLEALNSIPTLDRDINTILPIMREAIDDFAGGAPQFDDITMLAIRYSGPENKNRTEE